MEWGRKLGDSTCSVRSMQAWLISGQMLWLQGKNCKMMEYFRTVIL